MLCTKSQVFSDNLDILLSYLDTTLAFYISLNILILMNLINLYSLDEQIYFLWLATQRKC